jgi:hypothetical protein
MKLTANQIAIYKKFGGDEDGFARTATPEQRAAMKGVRWSDIDELVQALSIVRKGLASTQFRQDTLARARELTADDAAFEALTAL